MLILWKNVKGEVACRANGRALKDYFILSENRWKAAWETFDMASQVFEMYITISKVIEGISEVSARTVYEVSLFYSATRY